MKENNNTVKNMWIKYSSKNKGFPVITAFLLGLVCVQIFKVTGAISFEFVLPYLILIFFMYGLLHKCWIVGICQKWIYSGEKGLKFAAGAVAVTAVQGVLAEGALKIGNTIAIIPAVILMLVLYLYIWFALKCIADSGRYRFRENYAVYLAGGIYCNREERYFWDTGMDRLVPCADRGIRFNLSGFALLSGDI